MGIHTIFYKNGAKMMAPVHNRAEYLALRNSGDQISNVKRIREGEEKLKSSLVQMNYSCLPNDDGTLKGTTRMSNTVGMDIDLKAPESLSSVEQKIWKEDAMKKIPERVLAKKDELGLKMLERSATKGYHLVFGRRPELSQEENLIWASNLLGIEYDKGAKDITRVFFTTTGSDQDLLFLDESIFDIEAVEQNADASVPSTMSDEKPMDTSAPKAKKVYPTEYHGIPFSVIIDKYFDLFNDGKKPTEGDRDTWTFQLASDLRHICGRNADWLDQVIPCYDGFPPEEKRKKINSALNLKIEGMPTRIRQVLDSLKSYKGLKASGGTMTTPPPMPKKLPPLIKLLTKNVPDCYKAAVASAVFPSLGVHLHGVKFRYLDNVDHEATFMNVLIAMQSVGKGCIKKPIEYIMEDIRLRDIPNRQREMEWKQKNPSAKQKKDPRPTDICIQYLPANLTDAVFNQRLVDAHNNGERFLYLSVDEIEGLKKITSSNKVDEVGLLIRTSFDNALSGQDRVGADSVSGIAPMRMNFNASTTPTNAKKFFKKMVNDGTLSRLDICTIMVNDGDEEVMPVMGIYDQRFADELKPYIDRLEAANGLIECKQALKLAEEIRKENIDVYHLYDSEAYRVLSYRANVIAWLKGMVLYVAHGYKWSKEIADFVRWSEQYNLWCKMLYFGQQLEEEMRSEAEIQRQGGTQNLLENLPDEFTREQYIQMRSNFGKTNDGGTALRQWVKRKYIILDEVTGKYSKTEEYKKKYPSNA